MYITYVKYIIHISWCAMVGARSKTTGVIRFGWNNCCTSMYASRHRVCDESPGTKKGYDDGRDTI